MRELRAMFAKLNQRGWQRLMSDIKKVHSPKTPSTFGALRKNIEKFKVITLTGISNAKTKKQSKVIDKIAAKIMKKYEPAFKKLAKR